MKTASVLSLGIGVLALLLTPRGVGAEKPPHWELEMTGNDYYRLWESGQVPRVVRDQTFSSILEMGKRFYDWLNAINQNRPTGQKISLSSPQTQVAFPIDSPRLSNPERIDQAFAKLKGESPAWLSSVIFDGGALSPNCPVADGEFAAWGRKVTTVYESASRWALEEPYLADYAARKSADIRGYYFLSQEPDLSNRLSHWSFLDPQTRDRYSEWLVDQCLNAGISQNSCQGELEQALATGGGALTYYQRYQADGKRKWDSFFDITSQRSDVDWSSVHPNELRLPFETPSIASIKDFLVANIEDEWRYANWQLRLAFQSGGGVEVPHIEFEAGATPHVNEVGGSVITMDANSPLTEYSVQWTIRHEFGHVLGFPDCYLEFYDEPTKTMVSYQLDITNLMCSRRGHLQQGHVDELKRIYYRE